MIAVPIISDDGSLDILLTPEKAQLLVNVKQILDVLKESSSTTAVDLAPTTPKPTKATKTKRPRPTFIPNFIQAYKDTIPAISYAWTPPAFAHEITRKDPPAEAAKPDSVVIITNIENLQLALAGMASDIEKACDSKNPLVSTSLEPLKNPFIEQIQVVTKTQSDIIKNYLQLVSQVNGILLMPLSVLQPQNSLRKNEDIGEVDEKLIGLENAIKTTIQQMLPRMKYIEEFQVNSAGYEEWQEFNDSIDYVATRLKNKTIAQVLDPDKTKTLLESYEKYLNAVKLVRLLGAVDNGEPIDEAVRSMVQGKSGC